ncbi:helix-turn-helix domain-containing protein [Flavobacterium suzhouense]|uniref:Helix-turn-helix domain-containing protein n=1 Tax=Flavobacterium suzhouense TaxID=1529638 RepID=A0ABW5NYP3_9FLAO
MVNTDDFIKRLEIILDYYNLSASVFADKMGVQRSGLSHLMSGRNKPSLDFVMKIIENFPEVDFYWLMNGDGDFPKNEETKDTKPEGPVPISPATSLFETNNQGAFDLFSSEEVPVKENKTEPDLFSSSSQKQTETIRPTDSSAIERIVVFYKNGTFKNYNPEN